MSIYASRPWVHLYGEIPNDIVTEFPSALAIFRQAVTWARDLPAIKYFDASITYAELDRMTDELACALIEQGVQRGDRAACYLQNVPQFVIGLVAAWKVGAIGASMDVRW